MAHHSSCNPIYQQLRLALERSEQETLLALQQQAAISEEQRAAAGQTARILVQDIRNDSAPGLMEVFLAEYGLSTDEGVALMCLAEALLRVPDSATIDDLIEDKIVPSSWGEHLGKSTSSLVNAATWGLLLTGKVLNEDAKGALVGSLRSAVKRLGEPVIRLAVKRAMKEMGHQFVLGESIEAALQRGQKMVDTGYTYSFDMLGEAALLQADADQYFHAYKHAIQALGGSALSEDVRENPGISIKLSALHPRYEHTQRERVLAELAPKVLELAVLAKQYNLGLNIDAEEANRLGISLELIQTVFAHSELDNWDGFGVVVQAYNRAASTVLDFIYDLAQSHQRRIMVRLVKGAYWDSEIKHAQQEGAAHFPVFTRKPATDVSYLCCAKKLLSMLDYVYPQFATHNAHTVASIIELAQDNTDFEFQRLHGMGEALYRNLLNSNRNFRCRIYAPVGKHRDLLAYLVRRLLENGANSSFVNQIVDTDVPIREVVADPVTRLYASTVTTVVPPSQLFAPQRENSTGCDIQNPLDCEDFLALRAPYETHYWRSHSLLALAHTQSSTQPLCDPARPNAVVGEYMESNPSEVQAAAQCARPWGAVSDADVRKKVLLMVANAYETHAGEFFAILCREAGKNPSDAVAEIREAVDFLRYYASQIEVHAKRKHRGTFVCISPWNFPLAIFTGQICAALAAGNAVLAKPAEATPLIAYRAVQLFHAAGVPQTALQLLIGEGKTIGTALVSLSNIDGVCFTGSTQTAWRIHRAMAQNCHPNAPLIAETGGINAMVVDSTALPEQAVTDIVRSAFQSAGQRCSALRVLYLQDDIYTSFVKMLQGAMDELTLGHPWQLNSDIGPVISAQAQNKTRAYIEQAREQGALIKQCSDTQQSGYFVPPSLIAIDSIKDVQEEIFGPVLHVAKFAAPDLGTVLGDINATGYGLTFGLHTRIDRRVEQCTNTLKVGNIYVNRDQIGAVVGVQPFGGENLSGTGPKAGGPEYLKRFFAAQEPSEISSQQDKSEKNISLQQAQAIINSVRVPSELIQQQDMPGPTGESNRLRLFPRGLVLCLGADLAAAKKQVRIVEEFGCAAILICPGAKGENAMDGFLEREALRAIQGVQLVVLSSTLADMRAARMALAARQGGLIPLVSASDIPLMSQLERHVCINTTAAGGNAALLAEVS